MTEKRVEEGCCLICNNEIIFNGKFEAQKCVCGYGPKIKPCYMCDINIVDCGTCSLDEDNTPGHKEGKP